MTSIRRKTYNSDKEKHRMNKRCLLGSQNGERISQGKRKIKENLHYCPQSSLHYPGRCPASEVLELGKVRCPKTASPHKKGFPSHQYARFFFFLQKRRKRKSLTYVTGSHPSDALNPLVPHPGLFPDKISFIPLNPTVYNQGFKNPITG